MWAPKLRTPGIARSSLLARTVTRYISGCDVPGGVSQCIRKSRSLNEGSSDCPSNGQTAIPATTAAPVARYTGRGARMIRSRVPWYFRCSHPTSGDSRSIAARSRRIRHSAGVTVRATTMDASSASE